jgi:hypothetical protein
MGARGRTAAGRLRVSAGSAGLSGALVWAAAGRIRATEASIKLPERPTTCRRRSLLLGAQSASGMRDQERSRSSSFALVSVVGAPTPAQPGKSAGAVHDHAPSERPRSPDRPDRTDWGGSSLPCTPWSRCAPSNDGPIFVKCRNREAASHRFGRKSAPMSVGVSSSQRCGLASNHIAVLVSV